MPWGYKRYGAGKSTWNRGYSGKRYWNKGGVVKRSMGAARSYKTGVKNQYFNCSVSGFLTFNFNANSADSSVQTFIPYRGGFTVSGSGTSMTYTQKESETYHGGAVHDRNFRLMCSQYDEVKLVSMTVKLMPSETVPTGWSIKVGSVIDRNYTYTESQGRASMEGTDTDPQTARSIFENPGVVVQSFNANKSYTMNRYCYVKDLKEKSDFVDASVLYNLLIIKAH